MFYRDGTAAVTNGSTTVTGTGTRWSIQAKAGDVFFYGDKLYEIQTVTSDTSITLKTAFSGTTATGASYAIIPLSPSWSLSTETAHAVADFITKYANVNDTAQTAATNASTSATAAATAKTAAQTAQTNAETAEDNAEIWAEGTDAQVQGLNGTHSAKRWAELMPSIAAFNDLGINATVTEINYLSGVTSTIQTQLNNITNAYDMGEQKNSIFDPNCTNLGTISSPSDMATFLADYHVTTGKFGNLKLNNCITIAGSSLSGGNADWLIGGFNFYYNVGSSNVISKPHLALIPKTTLGNAVMNDPDEGTLANGYVGTKMHTETMATITDYLETTLGSYLLSCDRFLSSAMTGSLYNRFGSAGGGSSAWSWINTKCELMTEANVYGSIHWSSTGYDNGEGCRQLPIFRYITHNRYSRATFWLRSVSSSTSFCIARSSGDAFSYDASISFCVRPLIFIG